MTVAIRRHRNFQDAGVFGEEPDREDSLNRSYYREAIFADFIHKLP